MYLRLELCLFAMSSKIGIATVDTLNFPNIKGMCPGVNIPLTPRQIYLFALCFSASYPTTDKTLKKQS